MSSAQEYYLLAFMLDVFFAVGSGTLYIWALRAEDSLLAGGSAFSFAVACVGAALCFERLVF